MSDSPFNLDLNRIENLLSAQGLYVQPALSMPSLLSEPLQQDTVFVLLLDESASSASEIGGADITQLITERFAVVLALRSVGDSTGVNATAVLQDTIRKVKQTVVGLMIDNHDPIEYEAGRIIAVNRETQTVLYQLQFETSHTVVIDVRQCP